MKVLVAVALILLVGVLDETVAGFRRLPDGTAVLEGVRRLSKVGGLKSGGTSSPRARRDADADATADANATTDANDDDDDDDDDDMSLAAMCAMNGDAETIGNAVRRIEIVVDNISTIMDSPEFEASALESNRTDDASHVMTFMCSKKDDFKSYIGEVAEAAKMCFDSDTKLAIDGMKNLTAGFIEYMCQNDGSAFTNFVNSRGMECASERSQTLSTCTRNLFVDGVEEAVAAVHGGTSDEEDCNRMTEARTCIKTEFETCENTSNVDFILGVIDYFMTRVCGNEGETAEGKNIVE